MKNAQEMMPKTDENTTDVTNNYTFRTGWQIFNEFAKEFFLKIKTKYC